MNANKNLTNTIEIPPKRGRFQTSGSSKSVRVCIPKNILEIEAARRKLPLNIFIEEYEVKLFYRGKDGILLKFVANLDDDIRE